MNRRGFFVRVVAGIVAAVVAPLSILKAKDVYAGAPLTWDDYLEFMHRKRPKTGRKEYLGSVDVDLKVERVEAESRIIGTVTEFRDSQGQYFMGVDLSKGDDLMGVQVTDAKTGRVVVNISGFTGDEKAFAKQFGKIIRDAV